MIENEHFDGQLTQLQRTFWENVGSNLVNTCKTSSNECDVADKVQPIVFQQWLNEVDKNWQNKPTITSSEVEELYKKLSSSSHFFANFTETVTSNSLNKSADEMYQNIIDGFKTGASKTDNANQDVNSIWGQFSSIPQQQSLKSIISFFEEAADNPEFSATVKAYLTTLQKLQLIFFNLFKDSTIQTVEILNKDIDKLGSPKQIMFLCLDILETNYMLLIREESYSQAYAEVVNAWMFMLSQSNQSFADFIQSAKSTDHAKTKKSKKTADNTNHEK